MLLRNLPSLATYETLIEFGVHFGDVKSARVYVKADKSPTNIGVIEFKTEDQAQNATQRMNGLTLIDKQISTLWLKKE